MCWIISVFEAWNRAVRRGRIIRAMTPAILLAICSFAIAIQPQDPPKPSAPETPPAKGPSTNREPQSTTSPVKVTLEGALFEGTEGAILATGLRFAEGPLWRSDETLVICDLQGNAVYTINPEDGRMERKPGEGVAELRKPSGNAAGVAIDTEGRLVFAQFDGNVTRLSADGTLATVASEFGGKKLNNPNDLVVRTDGSIYFTDFAAGKDAEHVEHAGVYRIKPDGTVELLTKDVVAPNGLAFSRDEKTLYVALYRDSKVMAYDVAAEGGLSNPRVFAEVKDPEIKGRSTPDGVKVDARGNVWTTGAGGVWVFDPSGKRIGRIVVLMASNLCFGGKDGKTVFVTAGPRVVTARLKEPALPAPGTTPAPKPETTPDRP
jgi:gluconolactonase